MQCCETIRLSMARWLSSVKEAITNAVTGFNTPSDGSKGKNNTHAYNEYWSRISVSTVDPQLSLQYTFVQESS